MVMEEAGPDADVFVFALNGMEPAAGIVDMARPLLIETGWARLAPMRPASAPQRALAGLKAHTPSRLKQAYYAALPRDVTLRIA